MTPLRRVAAGTRALTREGKRNKAKGKRGKTMISQINVRSMTNEFIPVHALVRGNLAIHASIDREGFSANPVYAGWTVTHVPTGTGVLHTRSVKRAKDALEALSKLGDWDFVAKAYVGNRPMWDAPQRRFLKRAKRVVEQYYEIDPS